MKAVGVRELQKTLGEYFPRARSVGILVGESLA
jgi:hypothetical protein